MVAGEDFLSELAPEPDDFELLPESPEDPFEPEESEDEPEDPEESEEEPDEPSEPDPFDEPAGTVLDPLRLSVR